MLQIHEKIALAREAANLTQQELADKLGIERSTYQYWEQKTPGIDKIYRVAEALKLPKHYFFVEDDEIFKKSILTKANPENQVKDILQTKAMVKTLLVEVAVLKAEKEGRSKEEALLDIHQKTMSNLIDLTTQE